MSVIFEGSYMKSIVLPYLRNSNAEISFSFSNGDHYRRKYEVKKGRHRKKELKTSETGRSSGTPCIVLWYIFGKKNERHEFVVSDFWVNWFAVRFFFAPLLGKVVFCAVRNSFLPFTVLSQFYAHLFINKFFPT
jgi:hypothetical protein